MPKNQTSKYMSHPYKNEPSSARSYKTYTQKELNQMVQNKKEALRRKLRIIKSMNRQGAYSNLGYNSSSEIKRSFKQVETVPYIHFNKIIPRNNRTVFAKLTNASANSNMGKTKRNKK